MQQDKKLAPGRLARATDTAIASALLGASLLRPGTAPPTGSAARLARLRGLAAKLGQLLSYVDGLVPDESREAIRVAYASLVDATQPSPSTAIRAVVEEEFGREINTLFDRWDEQPIASASIAQVHRASFQGMDVAVKVQHPGIAEAIESDLANVALLQGVATRLLGDQLGTTGMMLELAEGFRAELDFKLEASSLLEFREIHADDPTIHIPELIPERCSRRVLTTTWAAGSSLNEVVGADPRLREQWCQTLWRFVFRGLLAHGRFNADPHPGNYFFQPDGTVTFLDFGCCRRLSDSSRERIVSVHYSAVQGDLPGFAAAATRMLELPIGPQADLSVRFVRECLRPLLESPFRVTNEFSGGMIRAAKEFGSALRGMRTEDVTAQPAELVFLNRLHFGFYSILAQLDSSVDYAGLEETLLARARARAR